MSGPTFILGILAIVFLGLGYWHSGKSALSHLPNVFRMLLSILPMIFFAFLIAEMVSILIPQEILSRWIGKESGWRGIWIGTLVGGFMPGGPYVSMPVAAGLLQAGASIGTMVAFLTSWSLWAIARLPLEVSIMGWRFTLIRLLSTFFFPPIAGFIAQVVSKGMIKTV